MLILSPNSVRRRSEMRCPRSVRLALLPALLAAFSAVAGLAQPGLAQPVQRKQVLRYAQAWVSSYDGQQRLQHLKPIVIETDAVSGIFIRVDPARQFQKIEGFGAALTDASVKLIQRSLTPQQRYALLKELFGHDQSGGLALSLTRITIGASDFSSSHYSYDDMPVGQSDPKLVRFSMSPARADLLPTLRQVQSVNPSLYVFATPWSAPGWMKTSGSLTKGSLLPQYYGAFARYLDRTLNGFAAEGVPIYALTIQNEPGFEPTDYPGMLMTTPQRAKFVGQYLGPLLAKNHSKVRILDWDHNWDKPQEPLAVLANPTAAKYLSGTAWHCYAGEPSAQSLVHDAFPNKETWFTECAGGAWAPDWGENLVWQTRNLIIGTTRNWAKGVILWNIALDQNNGPHLGGCGNCRAVVTIDNRTGAISRNVEYYVLGHASRHVQRGARRIESDAMVSDLETVAFRNPRGDSVVLIVVNTGKLSRAFSVNVGGGHISTSLAAGSVITLTWPLAAPIRD